MSGLTEGPNNAGQGSDERAVLLAAKLHVPTSRGPLVRRTGLVDALAAGRNHKLTVLSAPVGWGKTTLLAQWVDGASDGSRFAWLSLDSADNDPVWFWMYVTAAVQKASPGVGSRAFELLAMGADPLRVVLPTLLNDLAATSDQLVLVLDDYHVVTSPAVGEQMALVINRMPATLRLVLASRSDPMLPLARLRASGDLLEVRVDDLRFLDVEAGQLLNDIIGLDLTDADIELLCQRTEGWVAGLYLAALSLAGRSDATAFITTFAGDNRHIVDYLMAEVLDRQPPQLRGFLLRTSVLHRLSGTLCDAVLQTTGSTAVLEEIERENLFLVPLDLSRHWYRYHHLFGELLRTELQRAEPGLAEVLHGRAAVWFESEGLIDEAVRHLVAAGDVAGSADLIAADWVNEFHGGGLSTVSAWLDLLPAQTVWRDPRLSVVRAWVALNLGQLDTALSWIEAAEAESTPRASDGETIFAQLIVLRAIHSFKTGRLTAALKGARRAVTLDFGDAPLAASGARSIYGSALYFSGNVDDAAAAFEQAVALAEEAGDRRTRTNSLGYLAMIAAERGQLADAEQRIHRATGSDADLASGEHLIDAMVSLAAATVLFSRGDMTAAAEAAQVAVAASRQGGGILEVAHALLVRANIHQRLGGHQDAEADRTEAGALLAEAEASAADSVTGRNEKSAVGEELTLKELEVLRLLATQLSRREIAQRLYVSLNTVKSHQRGVYRKLGVVDRTSAVTRARELGLL